MSVSAESPSTPGESALNRRAESVRSIGLLRLAW
jgi:hypothetical protein